MSASPSPSATAATGQEAPLAGRPGGRAVAALQAALDAEHAAVYGYGVAGAHLAGAKQKAAARDWVVHEAARDTLAAMIIALGAQPVAAAAGYQLPFPVHSEQSAVMLAALLEDRVATAYLGLVALSEARLRMFGARALQSAALRATSWRGTALAFPGLEAPAPGPVLAGQGTTGPGPSTPGRSPSPPATGSAGG
jgi:Domain of unknown function (DUF4439)